MTHTPSSAHPGVLLARRWVIEYFNGQNENAAREFIAPGYCLQIGDYLFDGRDSQWLPAVAQQFAQFPGMGMTVHKVVVGSDNKANRVGVWFSEHGASGGPGGPVAVWSGIGIYRSEGEKLVGCCAQEDYYTRSRQLRSGVSDAVDPPAAAPWDTLPMGTNAQAEVCVQQWLNQSWPLLESSVHVDDEYITGQQLEFKVTSTEIVDLFSSGPDVVFNVRQRGFYRGGFAGVPERNREEVLNINGMVSVRDGAVYTGRVIRDRGGLKGRVSKD